MSHFSRRSFGRILLASASASLLPQLRAQDQCAPPDGTASDFVVPNLSNIQRKSIAQLTQNEVDRLRLAYAKLRALSESDPNDPRGWMQQANVHCWQCGGSGSDIHQCWTFLPWHRAFLYFHERILCKLLNDNSFRLPYWSWDFETTRSLPSVYRRAKIGNAVNPLYDDNRSTDAAGGGSIPSQTFPARRNPMNAANFESFGGGPDTGGALENGPHGAIHMWTGGTTDPYVDMGNLSYAARDPIFYAHHCNIDRLWAEWVRRNPVGHANPTDPDFLTHSFPFFDENAQLRTIRVQDVLQTEPLGFSYPPGAGLSKPKVPKWIKLDLDRSTQLIKLPPDARGALAGVVVRKYSLVLKQARVPEKSGVYNVFVGDAPATGANQAAAPNYLGYIGVILPHHAHDSRCSLVLDASKEFVQQANGSGALITVVEAGGTQGSKLEFGAAYITEE